MSESELDGLLGEISGPCTYDNMVKMFQEKMAGEGNDPDDLIVQAFKAYDNEGKIDSKMFEHALKTWGDKMTKAEIDDIFGEFEIDEDYMIKTKDVIGLFVSVKEEPKVEEPAPVEEAPEAEPEEDADAKKKAQDRLKLLQDTKEAWVGYADNNETIAQQFEVAEEEIKMVKKRYNLDDALADLKKRQDLYNKSNNTINGLFKDINDNFTCMSITLPEDKKKIVDKEIKAVEAKLEVVTRFKDTVAVVEENGTGW